MGAAVKERICFPEGVNSFFTEAFIEKGGKLFGKKCLPLKCIHSP